MLEVKSPWNNETVGTVQTHNSSEIEVLFKKYAEFLFIKVKTFPKNELMF